jgi:hypothetical protein
MGSRAQGPLQEGNNSTEGKEKLNHQALKRQDPQGQETHTMVDKGSRGAVRLQTLESSVLDSKVHSWVEYYAYQ